MGGGTLPPPLDVILGSKKAQGSIASFESFLEGFPIAGMKVNIDPVQEGSGNPSPDNIRPINGWTSCNIYHSGEDTSNPTIIPVSFPSEAGTVYGGSLEINEDGSGTLTINRVRILPMWYTFYPEVSAGGTCVNARFGRGQDSAWYSTPISKILSNCLTPVSGAVEIGSRPMYSIGIRPQNYYPLEIKLPPNYTTSELIKDLLGNIDGDGTPAEIILNRTPVSYPLTAFQITTLLGTNNIWADTGNVEVTYGDYLNIINSRLSALESNS